MKIRYFDLGLHSGLELADIQNFLPQISDDYELYGFEAAPTHFDKYCLNMLMITLKFITVLFLIVIIQLPNYFSKIKLVIVFIHQKIMLTKINILMSRLLNSQNG